MPRPAKVGCLSVQVIWTDLGVPLATRIYYNATDKVLKVLFCLICRCPL